METKESARLHPKWGFEADAAVDMSRTMDSDAGRTTRAIRAPVETPAEIEESFDGIAYGKAGAVIAMVENWVGEERFRKGVQAYLAAHEYANATAEDFWNAQTKVSGLPVDRVMQSFVVQTGVPLVRIGEATASSVSVSERQFFLEPPLKDAVAHVWTIPVCFRGGACQLIDEGDGVKITPPASTFLFANAGDKGYYRTDYSAATLKAIESNAETGLSVAERVGLLGDRWALMRAGTGSVGEILDLALAVKADPSATVIDNVMAKIRAIDAQIATDEDRARLNAVVRREFGAVYAAMGKGGRHDSDERADLRETLFEALGRAGDPAVLADATRETQTLFDGQRPKDPAVADAAVALVVAKGDAAMYEKMQRVAQTASDPDLKQDALRTLTRFQRPELVKRTLEFALSEGVRSQDSWTLIALLLGRRETQDAAWSFVQQHWAEIERKETPNSGARIIAATAAFCSVERRDQVTSFFAAHPVASAERTLAKSVASIDDCVALRSAQEPKLHQWLDAHTEK
jgi:aminopeptidase N/puromycin-sensitive aminopeptidase